MHFHSKRFFQVVGVNLIVLVCAKCDSAPAPDGGNGGGGALGGTDINQPGRPSTEVLGFFDANDPWAIGSPTFIALGVGDFIDFLLVSSGRIEDPICVAPTPAATVASEDDTLYLSTSSLTDPSGTRCSMNVSVSAAECAMDASTSGPPNPCLPPRAQGEVLLNGQTFAPGSLRIVRLAACDGVSSLLEPGDWSISSLHPFALPFLVDPAEYGAVVTIAGTGDSLGMSSVATGLDVNGEPAGCAGNASNGAVALQDGTLTIDLALDGEVDSSGLGSPGTCAFQFTGTRTFCEILDPSSLGGSGGAIRIERFDGAGNYQTSGRSGTIDTVYFSTAEPGETTGKGTASRIR